MHKKNCYVFFTKKFASKANSRTTAFIMKTSELMAELTFELYGVLLHKILIAVF